MWGTALTSWAATIRAPCSPCRKFESMKAAVRRDISQRVFASSPRQKPVSWIGMPPIENVFAKASRSISRLQSRSRSATHCRSSALA
jgi:hypothetical protein